MIALVAAAQVKGPHIDWAALSPILAPAAAGLCAAAGRPAPQRRWSASA